jgi:lipoprotein-anchoring transpeptidase ErfK/SrfK
MRRHTVAGLLVGIATLAAGCGGAGEQPRAVAPSASVPATVPATVPAAVSPRHTCVAGSARRLGTARRAYVGLAAKGAVAFKTPAGGVVARFGPKNANDYPTVFGVIGSVVGPDCRPVWYRVQLPIKPNGSTGFVRVAALRLQAVPTRIVVDISDRRLTLYERGRVALRATVAVGSDATPTPTGRYYVNQRLIPADTTGPFGPGAVGISAFSNVLTGWAQGGPVAIHGTNEPWSIGHAASNGCIRLPNDTLRKVFALAGAGTPVIIRA